MKKALLVLRLVMGWYFTYAGASKIFAATTWSAAKFLSGAKSFPALYGWFGSPANAGWVSFLNEWGLLFIGLGLIFGFWTRYASMAGILLMVLYFFAGFSFPWAGANPAGLLVDDHIIYIVIFWLFIVTNVGTYKGLDGRKLKTS